MSWKVALYDFIHARNQMEVDYDWNGLGIAVADEAYIQRQRILQDRRRRLHRERGLVPVRAESRLQIRDASEEEDGVRVGILLRTRLEWRIRSTSAEEETELSEQVTLRKHPCGKWVVFSVDSRTPEEGASLAAPEPDALWASAVLQPSAPFLIRNKLAPWKKEGGYNRELVRQYAEKYWNSYNPQFLHFDVDCSNYVSQCMLAGGLPMEDTGRRETGWWYRGRNGSQELWSFSWAVANALQIYLGGKRAGGLRAQQADSPKELEVGDVISYSWEGNGRYGHSTIVTGFDPEGMPLVNAHTVNSRMRYWDYSDSYAWTERTKYKFFHILDEKD